ncbi:hypothetical protein R3P38DRAFT_1295842, partial [Favolaschia claudopus]
PYWRTPPNLTSCQCAQLSTVHGLPESSAGVVGCVYNGHRPTLLGCLRSWTHHRPRRPHLHQRRRRGAAPSFIIIHRPPALAGASNTIKAFFLPAEVARNRHRRLFCGFQIDQDLKIFGYRDADVEIERLQLGYHIHLHVHLSRSSCGAASALSDGQCWQILKAGKQRKSARYGASGGDGYSIACNDCGQWCHAGVFPISKKSAPEEWSCLMCLSQRAMVVSSLVYSLASSAFPCLAIALALSF